MEVRRIQLSVTGFGAASRPARVETARLDAAERIRRAAAIFLVFLAIAVIAIPIPLVHFALVPGAVIVGIVWALLRLRPGEIFRAAHGTCPFCGAEQDFAVMGTFRLPKKVDCASCLRPLTLG